MEKYFNWMSMCGSILFTWLSFYLGGVDAAVRTLSIFLVTDYITGLICAAGLKEVNSSKGFWGIIKKICYLIPVGIAAQAGELINDGGSIRNIVIYFFVANEGISILENLAKLGIPYVEKLGIILEQLKK